MLQVSVSTIQQRQGEFRLNDEFEVYSDITDVKLDQIYTVITDNSQKGPLTPNMGRRRFISAFTNSKMESLYVLTLCQPCWYCFGVENDNPLQKIFGSNT